MPICTQGTDDEWYPAYYSTQSDVIAVAAVDSRNGNEAASFTNFGTWITVSAPGVDIYSTAYNSYTSTYGYNTKSGTSMACPHVAGVLALFLATPYGASLSYADVISCMKTSAIDISDSNDDGYRGMLGAGLIDAGSLVKGWCKAPSPVPTASAQPTPSPTPMPSGPTHDPTPLPSSIPTISPAPTVSDCVNHTVSLFDSFGDGWDWIDLFVGGRVYTLSSGDSYTTTRCLFIGATFYPHTCCGDSYSCSYDAEISWTITNANGDTVASGAGADCDATQDDIECSDDCTQPSNIFTVADLPTPTPSMPPTISGVPSVPPTPVPTRDWNLVYTLSIPSSSEDWDAYADIGYSTDDCSSIGSGEFSKIGYEIMLDDATMWVEFDAITADACKVGVPVDWSFDFAITGLTVIASDSTLDREDEDGYVEFWSNCYTQAADSGRPGASSST